MSGIMMKSNQIENQVVEHVCQININIPQVKINQIKINNLDNFNLEILTLLIQYSILLNNALFYIIFIIICIIPILNLSDNIKYLLKYLIIKTYHQQIHQQIQTNSINCKNLSKKHYIYQYYTSTQRLQAERVIESACIYPFIKEFVSEKYLQSLALQNIIQGLKTFIIFSCFRRTMELFLCGTNSPQQIFDIFSEENKNYQNEKDRQMTEEVIDNRINGASFFEDPRESNDYIADFRQENFIIDMAQKNQVNNKDFCVFEVEKPEPKRPKKRDPKKNICGYITKRAIRQLLSDKYKGFVWKLCVQYKCKKINLKKYLLSKIQSMIGPLHLQNLLNPSSDPVQMSCKKVFFHFFEWFIKERYIRYLTNDGKMDDKLLYIQYKNKTLARVIRTVKGRYEDLQK